MRVKIDPPPKSRVLEATDARLVVAIPRPIDYTMLGNEMILALYPEHAADLMHALEGWKDER